MRIKITQYGISVKNRGWDGVGDSGTDKFLGNHNNKLVDGVSCALTVSAQTILGAKAGDWLFIVFDDNTTQIRRFDDRAPESDPRLDLFNAWKERKQGSDFADVVVLSI